MLYYQQAENQKRSNLPSGKELDRSTTMQRTCNEHANTPVNAPPANRCAGQDRPSVKRSRGTNTSRTLYQSPLRTDGVDLRKHQLRARPPILGDAEHILADDQEEMRKPLDHNSPRNTRRNIFQAGLYFCRKNWPREDCVGADALWFAASLSMYSATRASSSACSISGCSDDCFCGLQSASSTMAARMTQRNSSCRLLAALLPRAIPVWHRNG